MHNAPQLSHETHYHDLIGSLGAIVWEADARTFQFTWVSPQAETILGYPSERWTEHDFWLEILHPEDRDWAVQLCVENLEQGRDSEFDYRVHAADGGVRWIHDIVRLVRNGEGEVVQLRGLMLDITEQKQQEAERERLRRVVLHDLKSPVGAILLNSDLLLTIPGLLGNEQAREFARGIQDACEQVIRLAADLQTERLHERQLAMQLRPCSVEELLRAAASAFHLRARERRVRIAVEAADGLWAHADRQRLRQVFGNLIENALRYTAPEGSIRIGAEERGERIRFFVADTGSGIPPERLEHLRSPHTGGGGGLGLAIVREIVEAHGGRVQIESVLGEGTVVYFTLRRAARPADG